MGIREDKIKQLLFDIAVVDTQLNGLNFDKDDNDDVARNKAIARPKLLRFKFMLQGDLNLYSAEEIAAVKKPKISVKKPVVIEEEIIERKEVEGLLYVMLMSYIAFSESKDKAFLMLAVELLAKDVIYEKKIIQRIV